MTIEFFNYLVKFLQYFQAYVFHSIMVFCLTFQDQYQIALIHHCLIHQDSCPILLFDWFQSPNLFFFPRFFIQNQILIFHLFFQIFNPHSFFTIIIINHPINVYVFQSKLVFYLFFSVHCLTTLKCFHLHFIVFGLQKFLEINFSHVDQFSIQYFLVSLLTSSFFYQLNHLFHFIYV